MSFSGTWYRHKYIFNININIYIIYSNFINTNYVIENIIYLYCYYCILAIK